MNLKPCPFCGGKAVFDSDDNGYNWIECTQCHVSSKAGVHAMEDCRPILAEAWNKRFTPPKVPKSNPFADQILLFGENLQVGNISKEKNEIAQCIAKPALNEDVLLEENFDYSGEHAEAIKHATSTIVIKLPVIFFDEKKGELLKAMPSMAGVPESGKAGKVFAYDANLYLIHGAMYHYGMQTAYAYRLIPRGLWNEDIIPVTTVKARCNEPRKSHIIYTGCLITYKNLEYVMYRPVEFVRESSDPTVCGNKSCGSYSTDHPDCCAVSNVEGLVKPVVECSSYREALEG